MANKKGNQIDKLAALFIFISIGYILVMLLTQPNTANLTELAIIFAILIVAGITANGLYQFDISENQGPIVLGASVIAFIVTIPTVLNGNFSISTPQQVLSLFGNISILYAPLRLFKILR